MPSSGRARTSLDLDQDMSAPSVLPGRDGSPDTGCDTGARITGWQPGQHPDRGYQGGGALGSSAAAARPHDSKCREACAPAWHLRPVQHLESRRGTGALPISQLEQWRQHPFEGRYHPAILWISPNHCPPCACSSLGTVTPSLGGNPGGGRPPPPPTPASLQPPARGAWAAAGGGH